MAEDTAETSRKATKASKSRRNLLIVDYGELTPRIRAMAEKNGMSVSHAARLLVRKALMSPKTDRVITVTIPDEALIQA